MSTNEGLLGTPQSLLGEIILAGTGLFAPVVPLPRIQYQILIGWKGRNAGVFRIGYSTIAPAIDSPGYDRIGYAFTPDYVNDPFSDVTGSATALTITRGKPSNTPTAAIDMGVCEVTLSDPDQLYNPQNSASPLNGEIREMRPCQVRASVDHGATWEDLFRGWLATEDTNYDVGTQTAKFRFNDIFLWLGRSPTTFVIPSTGLIRAGEAIGLVLDCIGFTNPAFRNLDLGGWLPDFSADGTRTGLDLIASIIQVDLGLFFQGRGGVVTYEDRWRRYLKTPVLTVTEVATANPGLDVAKIFNRTEVTREGGVTQVYEDGPSAQEFGPNDISPISSALLTDDNQAASLAEELVSRSLAPFNPVWAFNTSALAQDPSTVLQSEISDCMLSGDPVAPGLFYIEQLVHTVEAGRDHKISWVLSLKPDRFPFFIGRGKLAPDIHTPGYAVLTY